jgi:hypothetical protein
LAASPPDVPAETLRRSFEEILEIQTTSASEEILEIQTTSEITKA